MKTGPDPYSLENQHPAERPEECLEYVVVHEMVHLLERNHTERFRALLHRHYPTWAVIRERLTNNPTIQA